VNKLRLFTQFFLTKKIAGDRKRFFFFFRSPLKEKRKRKQKSPAGGLTMSAGWKGHLVNHIVG
jgi:hypothetical protein